MKILDTLVAFGLRRVTARLCRSWFLECHPVPGGKQCHHLELLLRRELVEQFRNLRRNLKFAPFSGNGGHARLLSRAVVS